MINQAHLKNGLIQYIELGFSIDSQAATISLDSKRITRGPDGGVFIKASDDIGRTYAPTGKFIIKTNNGDISVLDSKSFKEKYSPID